MHFTEGRFATGSSSESGSFRRSACLYIWTRHCPHCGRWLSKANAQEPWVCECGWTTA